MSNFQNQGKPSECDRDILIDFLMAKGYVGEMKMRSDYIELSNKCVPICTMSNLYLRCKVKMLITSTAFQVLV